MQELSSFLQKSRKKIINYSNLAATLYRVTHLPAAESSQRDAAAVGCLRTWKLRGMGVEGKRGPKKEMPRPFGCSSSSRHQTVHC